MNERQKKAHMLAAYTYADLSYCERKKVGCVIVKDDKIISIGYNGAPSGWDNGCEDCNNVTKPHIIHAEANAILKLAKSSGGGKGSTVFVTCAPCLPCALMLSTVEISEVYYAEEYRGTDGIELLLQHNIPVYQLNPKQ